jgi:hypothetical protein
VPRGSELKLLAQKEKNHARNSLEITPRSMVGRVECFYFDPLPASSRRVSQSLFP